VIHRRDEGVSYDRLIQACIYNTVMKIALMISFMTDRHNKYMTIYITFLYYYLLARNP
jgi:hypothetical protein